MSPTMQDAAFQSVKMDAIYVPFHVKPNHLKSAVEGMRALGVKGFNVMAPHKVKIIRRVDRLDELARAIGAVNTVLNRHGLLYGYNTDSVGAVKSLEDAGAQLDGCSILLFGAGGAARAVAYPLASRAHIIRIVNRTLAKAQRLRNHLKKLNAVIEIAPLRSKSIRDFLESTDIVVNASSMGQGGFNDVPIERSWFHSSQFVMDLVYAPLQTGFLTTAQDAGAMIIDGLQMLVNQGASSFEIWTGKKAPVAVMREAVQQRMEVQATASR
jgi:shikimate dehydrogenase